MRVTVQYCEEEIFLDLCKGQSFDDFKSWVHFRFQIPTSDKLIFKQQSTDDGMEVIPSYCQLRALKEDKRVVCIYNLSTKAVNTARTMAPDRSHWELKHWYPLLALVLLCVLLSDCGQSSSSSGGYASGHDREEGVSKDRGLKMMQLLRRGVDSYHLLWQTWGGGRLPDKVVVDAITTLVAYPVTTFYIRRVLNPDTGAGLLGEY